jgi:hypothetical protein
MRLTDGLTPHEARELTAKLATIDALLEGGGVGGPARCVTVATADHGAVGDGSTDDTAAIIAAINEAVSLGQADGSNYAEVHFTAGEHVIGGALVQGGTTKGNAQIPLPMISRTGPKFTLVLRGITGATALPYWLQTDPQASGVTLRSTLASPAYSSTYGAPSIIGGPTYEQGFGQAYLADYTNLCLVIDGLTVMCEPNATIHGVDLSGVAECMIPSLNCKSNAYPSSYAPLTATWSGVPGPGIIYPTGLILPSVGNNALATVGDFSCENWFIGLTPGEHAHLGNVRLIYCTAGLLLNATAIHGVLIDKLLTEACRTAIYADPQYTAAAPTIPLVVTLWDFESGGDTFPLVHFLYDPSSYLRGELRFTRFGSEPTTDQITGGEGVRLLDLSQYPGSVPAPAMPASGVGIRNTFYRDAVVTISGGTVTSISLDGGVTGLTSGTFVVPPGKYIGVTYSSTPTWVWTLL